MVGRFPFVGAKSYFQRRFAVSFLRDLGHCDNQTSKIDGQNE